MMTCRRHPRCRKWLRGCSGSGGKWGRATRLARAPPATAQVVARLQRRGVQLETANALARSTAMAGPKTVELLGANNESLRVIGTEAGTWVPLDAAGQRTLYNT